MGRQIKLEANYRWVKCNYPIYIYIYIYDIYYMLKDYIFSNGTNWFFNLYKFLYYETIIFPLKVTISLYKVVFINKKKKKGLYKVFSVCAQVLILPFEF